jgi:hypothetical protein
VKIDAMANRRIEHTRRRSTRHSALQTGGAIAILRDDCLGESELRVELNDAGMIEAEHFQRQLVHDSRQIDRHQWHERANHRHGDHRLEEEQEPPSLSPRHLRPDVAPQPLLLKEHLHCDRAVGLWRGSGLLLLLLRFLESTSSRLQQRLDRVCPDEVVAFSIRVTFSQLAQGLGRPKPI